MKGEVIVKGTVPAVEIRWDEVNVDYYQFPLLSSIERYRE